MRDHYHPTSTPPRPKARVRVEIPSRRLPECAVVIRNIDPVIAKSPWRLRLVLSGTQPDLEALFVDRWNRKLRMDAARQARQAKAVSDAA